MRDYLTENRLVLRKYRLGDEEALYNASGFTPDNAKEDVQSRILNWDERKSYTFLIEECCACPTATITIPSSRIIYATKYGKTGQLTRR